MIGALHLAVGHFLSPLGSHITDRFSYRFATALGSLAGIIGFLLASLSSRLWMMYLTFGCLSGFGHIIIANSCSLVVLQYFVKWRSLAVGIVQSSPAIGMFGITQLTQALISAFGWRWTLRGFAVLYFVCGLCSSVFAPHGRQKERSTDNNLISKSKKKNTSNPGLFRNRSFLIFTTSLVILLVGYFVPTVHIVSMNIFVTHIWWLIRAIEFLYLSCFFLILVYFLFFFLLFSVSSFFNFFLFYLFSF